MIIEFNVNDKTVSTQKGYTILQALSYIGIDIPHLCSYKINCTNNLKQISLLRCKLCLIKVKKINEDSYNFKYACNEIVENKMNILTNDEDIIKYRISLLKAILYMHKPICENCNVDYICKLKKYIEYYNIDIEYSFNYSHNNDISIQETKEFINNMNIPKFIYANYERCINCGICENYKPIDGYNSMIVDLCPTGVFEVKRDNKINKNIDEVKSIKSFCIGCNYLCDASYIYIDNGIKDILSPIKKQYGICDFGRKMDYYSNDIFEVPLINGIQNSFENAKELYLEFTNDANLFLAIYSSMYPIEDIKAFDDLIYSLNIQNIYYKKNKIATNSKISRNNSSNINKFSIKELKYEKYNHNLKINDKDFSKFIILGDSLDDKNDEIIEFSKKNKGNYIVFSTSFSLLTYNSFIAFPITGLGEFDGLFIDRYGKSKKMNSFLNKNRINLRDLLKYLYI